MSLQQTSIGTLSDTRTISKIMQAAMAICCGLVIVGFVGFSPLEVVHNAAHDTRHANAFPCH